MNATLGGSTIAAACGVNPYVSPIRLWCHLTGRYVLEETEAMRWGNRLQPVIFAALEEDGYKLVHAFEHRDAGRPWLVGHPDALAALYSDGAAAVVEAKASARGYDEPPLHYLAQIQTYLHLTGLDHAVLATLAGLHLDVAEVERSQHQIDLLLHLAERFMGYVADDVQPPPDGHPDDRAALVELYPDAAKDRRVRETREVRDARRELLKLVEREKAHKQRADALKAVIVNHMGAAELLVSAHDEVVASWKNTTARRLDTARFRKERPDVYDEYAQPQTTRRLLLT